MIEKNIAFYCGREGIMRKGNGNSRRILAAIVAAAMVVTSAPCPALTAKAAENGVEQTLSAQEEAGSAEEVKEGAAGGQEAEGENAGGSSGEENGDEAGGNAGQENGAPTGEDCGEQKDEEPGSSAEEGAQGEENGTGKTDSAEETGEEEQEQQPGEDNEEDSTSVSDNTTNISDNTTERGVLAVEKTAATGSLSVTGDTDKYSYDETEDKLTIMDGAELTISSAKGYSEENPSATIIYVEKDASASLTLDGLYIDMSGTGDLDARNAGKSPLLIEQDSTGDVTISIKGKNVLKAGVYCAAIQKNGQAASVGQLTISGEGELAVVGGINAAGIGGGVSGSVSNIRIQGGTIAVTGGAYAPAIGEGYMAICGSIVITGGSIRAKRFPATRDQEAVDFPVTNATDGTNPVAQTIVDLSAVYGPEAAVTDVTGTDYNFQGVKTDKEGKIYLYLPKNEENTDTQICFKGHPFIGFIGDDQKNELRELTAPDLVVEGDPSSYTYNNVARAFYVKDGAELTFHSAEGHDSTNPSESTICVEKDANASLTLDGVYIDASETGDEDARNAGKSPLLIEQDSTGDVTISLKGENVLKAGAYCAAIQKNGNAASAGKLTISGDGKLTATGGYLGAGIGSCSRASTANIVIAGGTVTATGGGYGAGIGGGYEGSATDITIAGGTVAATGGEYGAGIGGGDYGNAANITITAGTVIATGGLLSGVGIGSGKRGNATNITIAGGTVKVIGGYNGAEIGSADNVTITGGTIKTSRITNISAGARDETETFLAGASNGKEPVYRTIVDLKEDYGTQSPVTEVMETGYGMNGVYTDGEGRIEIYLPATPEGEQTRILFGKNYYAGTISSEEGADNRLTRQGEPREYDLNVYGDPAFYERETDTETGRSRIVVKDGAELSFRSPEGYGEEKPTKTTIYVEKDASAKLTLDGVYIDVSDTEDSETEDEPAGVSPLEIAGGDQGNIEVVLKGTNVLKAGYGCAGLQKNGGGTPGAKLTISGEGELQATGGPYGAGIGTGSGEFAEYITISSGTVTATGGQYGAGIGGGYHGDASDITISGGTVKATASWAAAGIGGGVSGYGYYITISGGNVTAIGSHYSAGIGGGNEGDGRHITISGGTVNAVGSGSGSGIGGGGNHAGGDITISGGTVTATGGDNGAGIGGFLKSQEIDTITISGGTVTAVGSYKAAGIGDAGIRGKGSNITISGGFITATGGISGGAGIGGGGTTQGASNITISGGTIIATGQGGASGIGDGSAKFQDTLVTITGGCAKANGISNGAKGADGQPVYLARADLMMLFGRSARLDQLALYTCKEDGSERAQISYGMSDIYTTPDGYLYVYFPANEEGTVTRADFGNTVYEATIREIPAEETEQYNELLLKSSTDGKAEPGEVSRDDVPEEGVPDGLWIAGLNEEGYIYTGKAIKPEIRVYDGKRLLVEKKDYTITYKNNVNAAAADSGKKAPVITVKSKGNYKGTATKTFTIQPLLLNNEWGLYADGVIAPTLYLAAPTGKNPKGIKAVPVVTYNGVRLKENRDYTLVHQTLNEQDEKNGNKNSYVKEGAYTIQIEGKGNYTGQIGVWVRIINTEKNSGHVLMSKVSVAKIPDVDYDAEKCIGESAPGMTPELTVTYGAGKNKTILYTVGDTDADGNTVTYQNADYFVNWINNKQAGTATAFIYGNGGFQYDGTASGTYFGNKYVTFKIKGTALKANMVSWAEAKSITRTYNGEAQEPEVRVGYTKKVKDENGKTVSQQVTLAKYDESTGKGDYTVTYLKNVDVGTATAVITGVNGYTGTVKKTFKITPVDLTAENTATAIRAAGDTSAESGAAAGEGGAESASAQIKVSYAKNGAKPQIRVTANLKAAGQEAAEAGTKTVTLEEGKDYTVSYANNKAVSEGKDLTEKKQPTIVIKGKGNYKGSLKQTFVITAKSLADSESPLTITVADVAANKAKGKYISKPVVTDADGGRLKEKTDYTLTYTLLNTDGTEKQLDPKKDAVDVAGSKIRVTITGAGNYAGENSVLTADYRVTERDFTKASFKMVTKSFSYTGKPVELTADDLKITFKTGSGKKAVTEELTLITDGDTTQDGYAIVGYQNNVNKGTAQVTLRGCGKYGGMKTVKFSIGTRSFLWWIKPEDKE